MSVDMVEADQVACAIFQMNAKQVKEAILQYPGQFKIDFTEEYLDSLPEERLRHILLAIKLYHQS